MSESSRPRFSIVIPTRERANTLKFTLDTCLTQGHESFEVIVCDNCSSPATRQVVESFAAPKVRYVRSDKPLAMSENWELAVSHAAGEYVVVVGDDDGLLPDALGGIDRVLLDTGVRCLRWERVYYSWPDMPAAEEANIVHIPLIGKSEILEGRAVMRAVANSEEDYTRLPMLYNSAIHSSLIGEMKARAGRLFASRTPDIFSGFAFAYLAGSYVSLGRPMTINAGSAKSNGCAHVYPQGDAAVAQDFRDLNESAGLGCHPEVPDFDVIALAAVVADGFLHARDLLFPGDEYLCLDRRRFIVNCVRELATRTHSTAVWQSHLTGLRESVAGEPELLAWFDAHHDELDATYAELLPARAAGSAAQAVRLGFDGHSLHLNAAEFGATDVMGVAELSARMLGKMDRVPTLENPPSTDRPSAIAPEKMDPEPTPDRPLGAYSRVRSAARIMIRGR